MDPLRSTVESALGKQYEVLHLIGRGGMGAVYLARERFLGRLVAVKVLPDDPAADGMARERFLREAQTAARLTHPSIVPLHNFVEAEGTLLYVMGYIEGESLEARLGREGRLAAADAARILSEIAGALDYAHAMGVVHRDIKPDNILLDAGTGRAYLTDFGIAKQSSEKSLTRTGMIVGTPQYVSPEQASGDRDVDGRSDIYSLGVVGYRMISGRLPFEGTGFQELLMQHVSKEPTPLAPDEAHPGLAPAVMQCLRKDPASRWPRGSALVEALRSRDVHELDLPDELGGLPSAISNTAIVWMVLYFILAIVYGLTDSRKVIEFGIAAPILGSTIPLLSAVLVGKRKGFGWRRVLTMAFWTPSIWGGWWPRQLRRPGDIWERLPRTVRLARGLWTISLAAAGVALPLMALTFVWYSRAKMAEADSIKWAVVFFGGIQGAAILASIIISQPWQKRFGISHLLAARLLWTPTWNNPIWKRPELATVLDADRPRRASPALAQESPAEIAAAISAVSAGLPDALRAAGNEAVVASRDLLRFIESADREVMALAREADPAERARLVQKLTAFEVGGSTIAPRSSQMRDLVQQQIALFDQLDQRRRQLVADRDRSAALLKNLHLQLANSRAQLARNAMSAPELSGQIRALCQELERQRLAAREVDALLTSPVARTVTESA